MSDILIPSSVITLTDYTIDARVIFDTIRTNGLYKTTLPLGTQFFNKLYINKIDVTQSTVYSHSTQSVSYSGGFYHPVVGDSVVIVYCISCPLTLMPEGKTSMQQYMVPPNPIPLSLAPGTWNSGIMLGGGYTKISVSLRASQACAVFVTRYVDQNGTVQEPNDPQQMALVAGQTGVLNILDGVPFGSFSITVNNTTGSPATTSHLFILLND